jgi:hypothetical protein
MFERVELKSSPQEKPSPPQRQIVVSIPSGAPVGVEEAIRTTLESFLLNGKAKSTLVFEHW